MSYSEYLSSILKDPKRKIHIPDDYDHTVGCIYSGYLQAIYILWFAFYAMSFAKKPNSDNKRIISMKNQLTFAAFCLGICQLLGAVVHQFYTVFDLPHITYHYVWLVACGFGYLGFLFIGLGQISVHFAVPKLLSAFMSSFSVIIIYNYPRTSFKFIMPLGLLFMFVGLISTIIYWKRNPSTVWSKIAFVEALGLVLSLYGAFVQLNRISFHTEYFNHNTIYHLLSIVGFTLIIGPSIFWEKEVSQFSMLVSQSMTKISKMNNLQIK